VKYYHENNAEVKAKMYGPLVNETIPLYLDRFEKIVSENGGYFVNGKVCYFASITMIIMLTYVKENRGVVL